MPIVTNGSSATPHNERIFGWYSTPGTTTSSATAGPSSYSMREPPDPTRGVPGSSHPSNEARLTNHARQETFPRSLHPRQADNPAQTSTPPGTVGGSVPPERESSSTESRIPSAADRAGPGKRAEAPAGHRPDRQPGTPGHPGRRLGTAVTGGRHRRSRRAGYGRRHGRWVWSAVQASRSASGQVFTTVSGGTAQAAARVQPYGCQSSWPGACASVSTLSRQPASTASRSSRFGGASRPRREGVSNAPPNPRQASKTVSAAISDSGRRDGRPLSPGVPATRRPVQCPRTSTFGLAIAVTIRGVIWSDG